MDDEGNELQNPKIILADLEIVGVIVPKEK